MRITGTPEEFVVWGVLMMVVAIAGLVTLPPTRRAIPGFIAGACVGMLGAACVVAGLEVMFQ